MTVQYSAGYTATGLGAQTRVGDFMPINLNVGYELDGLFSWTENAKLNFTINNVFDTNPPFANAGSGTANGSTLGRMVTFEIRKQF